MVRINDRLEVDDRELSFATSRSAGPGGQNVNKLETRVTLRFDVAASASLSETQKGRIRDRLAGRINRDGVLQVSAQRHRTQAANRQAATERFAELLAAALVRRKARRPTAAPPAVDRQRLASKRRRGRLKAERATPGPDD